VAITQGRLGAVLVLQDEKLVGIITDGDIRRMLEKDTDFLKLKAEQIMTKNPRVIESNALAVEAFHIMEQNSITQLVVVKGDKYKGIIHLHDILKEGIF
jgi:arabinose-5-phosphate isomerase